VDINLPELLVRVRAGQTGEGRNNKKQIEGMGIPALVKLGMAAYHLGARKPALFAAFQRLGGLVSHLVSPRNNYLPLPRWTGWGYSKDFPRLAMQPFRARWRNIKQTVGHYKEEVRQPAGESLPDTQVAPSLSVRFIDELATIGGIAYRIQEKELTNRLRGFLQERGIERICVDSIGKKYLPGIEVVHCPDPTVRVGVTGALVGIAESGSLVLVGGEDRPLTASLLPEIHIAILRASDLVPSLPDALARSEIRQAASSVIITGPSRTADIEMTLTIGVHGPRELYVFVIDENLE